MKNRVCVLLLLCFFVFIAGGQVPESDSLALVALYDSTNGPGWTVSTNWLQPGQPVSTWYAVFVVSNVVVALDMADNNLAGVIPPQLGDLTNLVTLDLSMNQLTGSIPPELGNMSSMKSLILGYNQLTDSIPPEICYLPNLENLELTNNQLTGSILPDIENLASLEYLRLRDNELTGPIPAEVFSLSNLNTLQLYNNGLTGPIPPGIDSLKNLEYLQLNYNQLTGPIPAGIGNLSNLKNIYMNNNQFSDTLPPEIGKLSNLQSLEINSNQLTGPIPPEIGDLASLRSLKLDHNQFTDSIPPEIGKLSNLEYLHFEYNSLTGTVPDELGDLTLLKYLRFDHNELTGNIPEGVGDMNDLSYLAMQNNKFDSPFPSGIKDLPMLSILNIYDNCFTFYDLAPLAGNAIGNFAYSPQCQVATAIHRIDKNSGDALQLDITALAVPEITVTGNSYKWWKDNDSLTSYSETTLMELSGLSDADRGYYYCSMINTDFPDLTLFTDSILVTVDAPFDITLYPDSVDENITPEYIVGTLSAEDPDQETGHTFALAEGDGSNDLDNYLFMIDGTDLITVDSPDYEIKPEFHIYVRATDEDMQTFDKALIVYVRDLPETGINDIELNNIKIYPNPAYSVINVQLPQSITYCTLELCSMDGRILYQDKRFDSNEVDIRDYPAGIYYIRIIYNRQTITRKIIINRR
jgi:Leucine-rich repeat (LRR) protein